MLRNLWKHLASLHRFSGREGVKAFWTYAMFVIVAQMWAMAAVMVPLLTQSMAKATEFARKHPESATVTSGPGHYSVQIKGNHPELLPDFLVLAQSVAVIAAVSIVLLAAALVRRLHDSGRAGWWALLPLPFLGTGLYLMPGLFADLQSKAEPDMDQFLLLFASNAVYLLCIGVLIYLSIKPGEAGANIYGAPPRDPGQL